MSVLSVPLLNTYLHAFGNLRLWWVQLHFWEGDGATNPGNHFQAHEGQEINQE